jgi:hypothetical protein
MAKAWYKLFYVTSINKVSQFLFFLSVAAKKHYEKQQQNKSIDHYFEWDGKDEAEQTVSVATGAEKLHLKAPSIARFCMYCYN